MNLTAALRPFHVRVLLQDWQLKPQPVYTTFQAMCLQLAAHVAEQTPYTLCKNEPCRRIFVRQRGRALFGQYHSEGVHFCDASCAKAQVQREYRRRIQARKFQAQGLSDAEIAGKMKLSIEKVEALLKRGSKGE